MYVSTLDSKRKMFVLIAFVLKFILNFRLSKKSYKTTIRLHRLVRYYVTNKPRNYIGPHRQQWTKLHNPFLRSVAGTTYYPRLKWRSKLHRPVLNF